MHTSSASHSPELDAALRDVEQLSDQLRRTQVELITTLADGQRARTLPRLVRHHTRRLARHRPERKHLGSEPRDCRAAASASGLAAAETTGRLHRQRRSSRYSGTPRSSETRRRAHGTGSASQAAAGHALPCFAAQENRGIIPLPNLETKFVAANSLIGLPRAQQMALKDERIAALEAERERVRHKLFKARSFEVKEKYRKRDKQLRAELRQLLKQGQLSDEASAALAHWDPYDQNAAAGVFDPEWMFGVTAGFDVVIGNPPYVRQEQIKELKPLLQTQYACYTGTADLYVYFYERALQLLGVDGVLTYISSNKYFRAAYVEKLRQYLSNQTTIRQVIDFGDAPIFTAIAFPSIIVVQKARSNANQTRVLTWQSESPITEFNEVFRANSFLMLQKELTADGWRLESQSVLRLLEKLRKVGKPLGEYVNGKLYRGIITGLNEAWVVDRTTRDKLIAEHDSSTEVLKPFLRGRDVKRWQVEYADQYLIKIESSENKQHVWSGKSKKEAEQIFAKTYPAIHAHLEKFRAGLIKRDDQGKNFFGS